LLINQELDEADAFVAAWLPGSEGAGISDVLFGDYDFQGSLSFSWPKIAAAEECSQDSQLFPFGYGLRYA
jgi:beta-glucosidase